MRLPTDAERAAWLQRQAERVRDEVARRGTHGTGRVESDARVSDDPEDACEPGPGDDED